jgi:hypothetical protein
MTSLPDRVLGRTQFGELGLGGGDKAGVAKVAGNGIGLFEEEAGVFGAAAQARQGVRCR